MSSGSPPTLHIFGCGRAGRVLARLWSVSNCLQIGCIVNRSRISARRAVDFIGAGQPAGELVDPAASDWLMLALPDSEIEAQVRVLADRLPSAPALAFHISGAVPAQTLRPLGCPVAAVHPVFPFADPDTAPERFAGSHALGEGDEAALDRLLPMFEAIGAITQRFRPRDKRLYHAATIAASNFLAVLDAMALDLAAASGVEPEAIGPVLVSLQRAALSGIEHSGPVQALTGPIERGDLRTCQGLLAALDQVQSSDRELFLAMARGTLTLARRKRGRHAALDALESVLNERGAANGGI